jgi:hypothetical protein
MIVWANGWVMVAIAAPGALQIAVLMLLARGYRVASSLVLGLFGIAWIVGVELFLHFFDRFLSRN